MPYSWAFSSPWEDFFTVVQGDQRGVGKNAAGFDRQANLPKMTLAQHVADAIEVIEHLRRKLGKQRVVLLGYSWGSSVGVHVAAQRPDLLHAYVGTGQVTSGAAGAYWSYGYPFALGLVALVAGSLLYYFRRRGWL